MSRIEGRLEELGLKLPEPMQPPGNFRLAQVHRGLCYVAGHTAVDGSTVLAQGVVGRDLTLEQGYEAARMTRLSILATLKQELGELDRISTWLRAVGYVQSAPDFHENAAVINSFSDLIVELWGDAGRHARSAPGQGPRRSRPGHHRRDCGRRLAASVNPGETPTRRPQTRLTSR